MIQIGGRDLPKMYSNYGATRMDWVGKSTTSLQRIYGDN